MRIGRHEPRIPPPAAADPGAPRPPASDPGPTGAAGAAHAAADPGAPSPFARLLRELGHEVSRGEAVMRGALGAPGAAGGLGPAELIALQAGVYRYSEAVDLAAKLVDHATSGLKTVVQGQ
jgi:hypothetical protein